MFDLERGKDRAPNWLTAINPDGIDLDIDGKYRHYNSLSTAADAVVASGRRALVW